MHVWLFILITSCLLVFYNYIGYAIPIYFWNRLQKDRPPVPPPVPAPAHPPAPEYWPAVYFIVAAYNEKDFIREKIRNSLDQDYPREKLRIHFHHRRLH